jgi:hypothetical protein
VAKAGNGKAAKKAGKDEKPDKPKAKAKAAKAKLKDAKSKDAKPKTGKSAGDEKAEPAPPRSARPATNANGVTQTAALTPGSEPDDVLSGLIR